MEPSFPLRKGHSSPLHHFSAHVYCGQTAGWMRMSLGTEVGLGLSTIVFDVNPATPRKKAHPPHPILAHVLWTNGWMDEDATWYGSRSRPRPHCTRRDPSSRDRGTAASPSSVRVYCSHGRHLSYCCAIVTYSTLYTFSVLLNNAKSLHCIPLQMYSHTLYTFWLPK